MHYYNIHNIVKISSEVQLYELEYFASQELPDSYADIIVRKDNNIPISSRVRLRRKLAIEESGDHKRVVYSEHLGSFGAQFAILFQDTTIEIVVNDLIANSKHVLYVNLVEPLLRFVLLYKGYVLLHSACIDLQQYEGDNDHGILFSAPPDTGKTTTVIKCVRDGFRFLSDDMTIVHPPNRALCFPKPMTISSHTFKTATSSSHGNSQEGHDIPRTSLRIRSLVHSKNGRQFMRRLGAHNVPIFTVNTIGQMVVRPPKFKVEDLVQNVKVKHETKVRNLYFLEKGGEEVQALPAGVALAKAIENSDDAFLFPPYSELIPHIQFGSASAKRLLNDEKEILKEFLSNINCNLIKSDSRAWYKTVTRFAYDTVA